MVHKHEDRDHMLRNRIRALFGPVSPVRRRPERSVEAVRERCRNL